MKIARTWKAAVAVAAVLLVSAGGAYAWIVFTRPPELALAGPIARSPAPSAPAASAASDFVGRETEMEIAARSA